METDNFNRVIIEIYIFLNCWKVSLNGTYYRSGAKELMPLNCGVGEDSWESLRLQGGQTSQPVNPKEISPKYSLEELMLKLKLLMWRTESLGKTLMVGKIEGMRRRGWDDWMASLTQWTRVRLLSDSYPGVGDVQGSLA